MIREKVVSDLESWIADGAMAELGDDGLRKAAYRGG
jgi:hypothetical protein